MILHALGLAVSGIAGYLLADGSGAAMAVLSWPAVVYAWRRARAVLASPATALDALPPSVYADIEDVIDCLDDLARERGWDLPKRLAIARLACEHRSIAFEELERRYDAQVQAEGAMAAPGARSGPP